MRKLLLICLLLLILGKISFAQRHTIWYFGKEAGLDFRVRGNQEIPVVLSNGAMQAQEASGSVTDTSGALLFYTNGVTVYNKKHETMANGQNIGGDVSACQSGLIIPHPGMPDRYYIFTTDAGENDFLNDYMYSIVDMNANGGLGEVISKQNLLWASCTERLTAARHANGIDVWLITNDNSSNTFRSWLIDCGGLNMSPVVSNSGVVMTIHTQINGGFMKVSPDGRQLCQTHLPGVSLPGQAQSFIQLFDFDNNTGIISNAKQISHGGLRFTGCEYAPNSQLLYLLSPYDEVLFQLQPRLATVPAIEASFVNLGELKNYYGIVGAPDEKIYLLNYGRKVSVIEEPNKTGTDCNVNISKIDLAPRSGLVGSPGFINDAFFNPYHGFDYKITDSCKGIVEFNGFTTLSLSTVTWLWDFGDGVFSNQQNPQHTFSQAQAVHGVKLTISLPAGCGQIVRTRYIQPQVKIKTPTITHAAKCDPDYVSFTSSYLPAADDRIEWDFGDGFFSNQSSPRHTYTTMGNYPIKLTITGVNGCIKAIAKDTVRLRDVELEVPSFLVAVAGQSLPIAAYSPTAVTYKWTPSTGLNNASVSKPTALLFADIRYKVQVKDINGCKAEKWVTVTVVEPAAIFIPTAFTPGNDGLNDLLTPVYPSSLTLSDYSIYNRWGQRVFTTRKRGEGWNGKSNNIPQPAGVYTWIFSAKDANGKGLLRKGTLTLIR